MFMLENHVKRIDDVLFLVDGTGKRNVGSSFLDISGFSLVVHFMAFAGSEKAWCWFEIFIFLRKQKYSITFLLTFAFFYAPMELMISN